MKRFSIAYLVIGLALCCVLSVGTLLLGPGSAVGNEVLPGFPKLWEDGLNDSFLAEMTDWYAGRFRYRSELITANAKLNASLLGSSANENVILGREGWLYFASTLADFTGETPLPEEEVEAAACNLALMQEYCASRGADFTFVCVPNKNTLYPEYMPNLGSVNELHDCQRLNARLETLGVKTVDLTFVFRQQPEKLYFAHDSHWNSRGAALAGDTINAVLGKSSAYFADDFSASQPHSGDLYEMLYPAAADPETDPVFGGTLNYAYGERSGKRPDSITIYTESTAPGSLLMYRDSFGNLLYPYLADSFGTATFSRSASYDLTCEAESVVIELVERNLVRLVTEIPVMPAPKREVPSGVPIVPADLHSETGTLPGFTLWCGTAAPGELLLITDTSVYACFRQQNGGFAAWIPENEQVIGIYQP